MADINLSWLESAIKDKYGVSKLLSAELKLAVADGDNYVSKIFRVVLQALLCNGTHKEITVILKRKIDMGFEKKEDNDKLDELFHNEYIVYADILNNMSKFFKEILWAECLAYDPKKDIYFEDLKASGHDISNRLDGLDFNHCLMVFKYLAKFHAASTIAIDQGLLDVTNFKHYVITQMTSEARKSKSNSYLMMVDIIRKEWGSEWSSLADKVEEVWIDVARKIEEIDKLKEGGLNVLNHGDTWVNNMMFKYDSEGKPSSLKFVDFQLCHYNSYGMDLCYFLSSSVQPDLKKKHLDEWIQAYCDSFASCLEQNASSLPRPTPDMVKKELTRLAPVSLSVSFRIRPIIMAPPEFSMPISELVKDAGVNSKKRRIFTNPKYTEVMKQDLPYLLKMSGY